MHRAEAGLDLATAIPDPAELEEDNLTASPRRKRAEDGRDVGGVGLTGPFAGQGLHSSAPPGEGSSLDAVDTCSNVSTRCGEALRSMFGRQGHCRSSMSFSKPSNRRI
mmetsp:Transcript_79503/g.221226  ORF Transcript_79503/g.221226 Transcript_79503/m.221226 type:complete len:108 (-) Transcript_79503:598-921(-)